MNYFIIGIDVSICYYGVVYVDFFFVIQFNIDEVFFYSGIVIVVQCGCVNWFGQYMVFDKFL